MNEINNSAEFGLTALSNSTTRADLIVNRGSFILRNPVEGACSPTTPPGSGLGGDIRIYFVACLNIQARRYILCCRTHLTGPGRRIDPLLQ